VKIKSRSGYVPAPAFFAAGVQVKILCDLMKTGSGSRSFPGGIAPLPTEEKSGMIKREIQSGRRLDPCWIF
jgi:hypothetical protein